jgi:hypothetical protein
MAPTRSSRASGADTDTSMGDASDRIRQLPVDPMVRSFPLILTGFDSLRTVLHRSFILDYATALED